jgi:large subunit ribosomal protein L25
MSQSEVTIECQVRETAGTNDARRLRASKMIPAVVYGGGRDPQAVSVDPRPIESVLDTPLGLNTLIHLRVSGRELKRMVMIREVQRHPVTESLMHCDFVRVELDQRIEVNVPVDLVGTPEGVKNEGGLLEMVHREIVVSSLPDRIPATLQADISALHVGQHLEAGEIALPEGVELAMDPSETLCTVVGKSSQLDEAELEGEEAAEEEEAAAADESEESSEE